MDVAGRAERVFPEFTYEEEQVLISLPYRVGLYVSFADTTGGFEAQDVEMQSLSNILREFAEDYCKSEFSQRVLMECIRVRSEWPAWSKNIEAVPEDARGVVDKLEVHFDDRALRAFKEVLVEIALAVAMAFHEDGGHAGVKSPRLSVFGEILGRFIGSVGIKPDPLSHTNISKSERAALNRLCRAINHDLT